MTEGNWTEAEVAYLRKHAEAGDTARNIAGWMTTKFGRHISRSAVIGKCSRLNIKLKARRHIPKSGFEAPPPALESLDRTDTLAHVPAGCCVWPEGSGPYSFDCRKKARLGPYCFAHHKRAYLPRRVKT